MYRTISIGSNILIQGEQERMAPDGRVVIRVGNQMVQGWPVNRFSQSEPDTENHPKEVQH